MTYIDRAEARLKELMELAKRTEQAEARALDNLNSANFYRNESNEWMRRAEAAEAALAAMQAENRQTWDEIAQAKANEDRKWDAATTALRARAEAAEASAKDRADEAAACHEIMAECRNIAMDPHNSTVDAVRGLLARAEVAEAALAQCQAWRQEEADNLNHCIRAKQKLLDDRSMLRRALAQLVGADTVEELRNMETIMRAAPAPAQDKAAAIDAIHALIEVQP